MNTVGWRRRGVDVIKWLLLSGALVAGSALSHTIAEGDQGYVGEITGVHLVPFAYLGAKHMVTGSDHLLFLCGVIFFLYRLLVSLLSYLF